MLESKIQRIDDAHQNRKYCVPVECVAAELWRDVLLYQPLFERHLPIQIGRFVAALGRLPDPITVESLTGADAESAFKFEPATGELILNLDGILSVLRLIQASTRNRHYRRALCKISVEQQIFHELYHFATDLVRHTDASWLSQNAPEKLGEIDLRADVFAATAGALLERFRRSPDPDFEYYEAFYQQLVVMLEFALPIFGAPSEKLHKQQRFLGLALMAAGLKHMLESRKANSFTSTIFETPLWPIWTDDRNEFAILALAPDPVFFISPTAVDPNILGELLDNLDHHPVGTIVDKVRAFSGEFYEN